MGALDVGVVDNMELLAGRAAKGPCEVVTSVRTSPALAPCGLAVKGSDTASLAQFDGELRWLGYTAQLRLAVDIGVLTPYQRHIEIGVLFGM